MQQLSRIPPIDVRLPHEPRRPGQPALAHGFFPEGGKGAAGALAGDGVDAAGGAAGEVHEEAVDDDVDGDFVKGGLVVGVREAGGEGHGEGEGGEEGGADGGGGGGGADFVVWGGG